MRRAILGLLMCWCLSGCMIVQLGVTNPIPELSTVAVTPFFNLSEERSVDGRRFANAYFTELQKIPGYEVVPVGVAEQAIVAHKLDMNSPADIERLAEILHVDAVVVGAVTEYDPYNPPRIGLKVEWISPYAWKFQPGLPIDRNLRYDLKELDLEQDKIETETWKPYKVTRSIGDKFIIRGQSPTNELPPWPAGHAGPQGSRANQAAEVPRTPVENTAFSTSSYAMQPRQVQPIPTVAPTGSPVHAAGGREPYLPPPAPPVSPDQVPFIENDEWGHGPMAPFPIEDAPSPDEPILLPEEPESTRRTPPMPKAAPRSILPPDELNDLIYPPAAGQQQMQQPNPFATIDVTPSAPPVMAYTRMFDGTDADLLATLRDYVELSGDTRSGGWQAYLQRSDDFIRFCSHVMIYEMLMEHGGEARQRVVFKFRKYK